MLETISSLFAKLDQFENRIPLQTLRAWLPDFELTIDDLRPVMRFHPDRYTRNLLHQGPAYQALVLCWHNGQRSPIHDHQGSSCGVKIIEGVATETTFERAPNGMIFPTKSEHLSPGFICARQDADIHQVSNLQAADADLVTLHIYSPPLLTMNVYSLDATESVKFDDPINDEFFSGGGI